MYPLRQRMAAAVITPSGAPLAHHRVEPGAITRRLFQRKDAVADERMRAPAARMSAISLSCAGAPAPSRQIFHIAIQTLRNIFKIVGDGRVELTASLHDGPTTIFSI